MCNMTQEVESSTFFIEIYFHANFKLKKHINDSHPAIPVVDINEWQGCRCWWNWFVLSPQVFTCRFVYSAIVLKFKYFCSVLPLWNWNLPLRVWKDQGFYPGPTCLATCCWTCAWSLTGWCYHRDSIQIMGYCEQSP